MPVLNSNPLVRFLLSVRNCLTRYSPLNELTILLYRIFRIMAIAILNFTFNPGTYFSTRVIKNVQPKFRCVENPLVSVILPTYNHGDYIKGAIDSILDQDFHNLELILVNDGSTDATSEIINEYRTDSRIKIIEQDNRGLPKSLNRGFNLAKGDFYTWTSADNLLSKNAISDLVKAANRETHSGLFYSDFQVIGENGLPLKRDNLWRIYDRDKKNRSIVRVKKTGKFFREVPSNFVGPYFLYGASLGKTLKNYSHTPGIEDWDFWLRMQFLTRFEYVPTSGLNYQYRVHQNSMSSNLDVEQNFMTTLELSLKITKKRLSTKDLSAKIDPLISETLYARFYKDRL